MNQEVMHYWILGTALIINGLGCLFILKKNIRRYGIVLIISMAVSSCLCLLFYSLDFYRFVPPLKHVLPVVAISFSCLALFIIKFRPERRTFPFFFVILTLLFSIEVLLKDYWGIIRFRNGWDYWDSYSLYWVYSRVFDHVGEYVVPAADRTPVKSDTKLYWGVFGLMILYAGFGVYILNKGWIYTFL